MYCIMLNFSAFAIAFRGMYGIRIKALQGRTAIDAPTINIRWAKTCSDTWYNSLCCQQCCGHFARLAAYIYIPLISRVRGPYGKLSTEFFPFLLWPKREVHGSWKQGRKKRGSIICQTDQANEVNKVFIIWLCWLFRKGTGIFDVLTGDQELEVRTATYGPRIDQSQHARSVSHITRVRGGVLPYSLGGGVLLGSRSSYLY